MAIVFHGPEQGLDDAAAESLAQGGRGEVALPAGEVSSCRREGRRALKSIRSSGCPCPLAIGQPVPVPACRGGVLRSASLCRADQIPTCCGACRYVRSTCRELLRRRPSTLSLFATDLLSAGSFKRKPTLQLFFDISGAAREQLWLGRSVGG
jgi:hypothetical protein